MKKLFLIDAYAVIYRAYYAFIRNPRINSKGLNTSAVFGFINTLEDVLKREKPTHIAIAFDPKGKTFRHEAFEQYKAQREATPEDIRIAIPIIKRLIEAYNIPILEVEGFEADDVIGTIAKKAEEEGFIVYMLTPDKDYGQLVSNSIFMYRPKHTGGFEVMGPKEVSEKFDLSSHEQVIDLLGLMGDASDNIPGCPGVGEKTASKLLKEFGSIDQLLLRTNELKGALKSKIEANREQIVFSRFLATIKTDVPVLFDEESLKIENRDITKLKTIFDELEFRTMSSKLENQPFCSLPPDEPVNQITYRKSKKINPQMSLFDNQVEVEASQDVNEVIPEPVPDKQSGILSIINTPHKYQLIDSKEQRANLISKLFIQKSICFDTETTGLNVFMDELVGLSFCFKAGEAFFVPLPESREATNQILLEFKPIFEAAHIEKIGQNIKFDLLMLAQYGINLKGKLFDTMIAHYLIQPDLKHGMDYLAEIYLQYKTIHFAELLGGKGKKQLNIRQIDPQELSDYAAEDADITFKLKEKLEKEIKENKLEELFCNIEMPLLEVLATVEQNGVIIDGNALKQSSETLSAALASLEKEIHLIAKKEFNVSSPSQVGEILFEKLKLDDKAKKTKTGQYSTSEEVLEKIKTKHPIIEKILEFRKLKKLLSTYIDALPELINPKSGKIHTSYNQTVASTGRLSSTNPNLQNIPIRDEQGKEIRKAFIPEKDSTFISADYSQIELRIMAHLSGDEHMINAFNSGYDIHTATAAKIYKVSIDEVNSDMRRKAKTANFGIIYGISAFGLAERLSISRTEAKELIDGYFNTYPDIKRYMDKAIDTAKEKGYVETIFGRRRYLADINSQNSIVRGYAERNAINAPIQGSAADIIKIAMINIQRKIQENGLSTKMTMQVHDELNFTVPLNEIDIALHIIREEMENTVKLKVPLIADIGTGNNWLEAH